MGLHSEALGLHMRALAIIERVLGPERPDGVVPPNKAARAHEGGGKEEAGGKFPRYSRTLSVCETTLGPDHPDVGSQLNRCIFF